MRARHRRHPRKRLRARSRDRRAVRGRGGALPGRGSEGGDRRPRKAHARRRRRSRIRGGGAAARRDPPARAGRSRACRRRRPADRRATQRALDRGPRRRLGARGDPRQDARAQGTPCRSAAEPLMPTALTGALPAPPVPKAALVTGGGAAHRPRAGAGAGRGRLCRRGALPPLARRGRGGGRDDPRHGRRGGGARRRSRRRGCRARTAAAGRAALRAGRLPGQQRRRYSSDDTVATATRASWDRHLAVNLRAPFVLMQDFAARLPAEAGGVIVNMLDERVWSLTPYFVSYTLSKAGLWTLTQTMALALAPRIRVNGIGPGPTLPSPRQSPEQFARQCRADAARPRHQPAGDRRGDALHPVGAGDDRADDRARWRPASGMGAAAAPRRWSNSRASRCANPTSVAAGC